MKNTSQSRTREEFWTRWKSPPLAWCVFLRFSSFDGTDAVFVSSFHLRSASAGASFACAHTPHPSATPPPSPPSGEGLGGESYLGRSARRLPSPSREGLVGDCYLGRGACGEPSPLRGKVGFLEQGGRKLG